jgi:hypothetical protein
MRLPRLLAFRLGLLGLLVVGLSMFGNTGSLTQSTPPSSGNPSFILQHKSASDSQAGGSSRTTPGTSSSSTSVNVTTNGSTSVTTESSSSSTVTKGSTSSQGSSNSPVAPIQPPPACFCGAGEFPTCSNCADPIPPGGGCPPCSQPNYGRYMCAMYCRAPSPEPAEPLN